MDYIKMHTYIMYDVQYVLINYKFYSELLTKIKRLNFRS